MDAKRYFLPLKKWLFVLTLMLLFWQLGTVAAPLLKNSRSSLGFQIHSLYQPACHQLAERSFTLNGIPLSICARCSGIYLAGFLICLYCLFPAGLKMYPLHTYILLILPAAFEFLLEKTGFYPGQIWVRFVSGLLFGSALFHLLVLSFSRRLDEIGLKKTKTLFNQ